MRFAADRMNDVRARFSAPAEAVSSSGRASAGIGPRLEARAAATISPLL